MKKGGKRFEVSRGCSSILVSISLQKMQRMPTHPALLDSDCLLQEQSGRVQSRDVSDFGSASGFNFMLEYL